MKLAYEAYDKSGALVTDQIEAVSDTEAREKLRESGLYVSSISELTEEGKLKSGSRNVAAKPRGNLKHVAMWSRQLSVLLRSGTPLTQALGAVERQTTSHAWQAVLADLRQSVEEGQSLAQSMHRYQDIFNGVIRSLTAAGESSGKLATMLDRVADMTRQQLRIRRTILASMVYPCLLITIGITVVLVMFIFVLPRFAALFESIGVPIPGSTMLLMSMSTFLKSYWWVVLLGLATAISGARLLLAMESVRSIIESVMLRVPILGKLMRGLITARIARLLGVLIESRVPLLDSLRLAKEAAGLRGYTELMEEAEEAAEVGDSISGVFMRSPLIMPSVSEAMSHGESNGQIGAVLIDMADVLDEENTTLVQTTTKTLEPLILIVLGCVIGFIALSLFIPLFDISAMAGGAA